MNKAVVLCLIHIGINLAIGIMLVFFPVFVALGATGGFVYDSTVSGDINDSMAHSINPGGEVEDAGDATYRLLDSINIGFFAKFLDMIDNFMFGFYNILYNVFGSLMETAQRGFLFGAIKGIITILYILTALYWWTNRSATES